MDSSWEMLPGPKDGVSRVRFTHNNLLLAASWDKSVRIYDPLASSGSAANLVQHIQHSVPVLDVASHNAKSEIYYAGLDGELFMADLNNNIISNKQSLCRHDKAIRCIEFNQQHSLVITGSWDSTLKLTDPLSPQSISIPLPGKVYAMDTQDHLVLVGMSDRLLSLYDLRQTAQPLMSRPSSLPYQTRSLALMPDLTCFAIGSIEGRVGVEYISTDATPKSHMSDKKNYAFRCHRKQQADTELIYPVHDLVFHPRYHTFLTAGGDGTMSTWDPWNKKRIKHLTGFRSGVCSVALNAEGDLMAMGVGYAYEQGERDHEAEQVLVRRVEPSDFKPKSLATS